MTSPVELPSGTVTFLFTDIEGSTGLLKQLGGRYVEALAHRRQVLRTAFEDHGGHEFGTAGDAMFVAFRRARDAFAAAAAGQLALAGQRWPGGAELRVRMGLHTGEPDVDEANYAGLGVLKAARISSAGHGGQVLLSSTTRELVADDLPESLALRDLADHLLKGLDRLERVYELRYPGAAPRVPADRGARPPSCSDGCPRVAVGRARGRARAGRGAVVHRRGRAPAQWFSSRGRRESARPASCEPLANAPPRAP